MILRQINGDFPKEGKFIAFFDDGSGGRLFSIMDNGEILDAEGETYTQEEFDRYDQWAKIPDDFMLWFEVDRGS